MNGGVLMGFFDDIFLQPFGGMFDMNGDGKTDLAEKWLGYMVINECMKEAENENSYWGSSFLMDDDTDFWQLGCEDGFDYGVDPEDFDTEDEYIEAFAEAKNEQANQFCVPNQQEFTIPIKLTFTVERPGQEELDKIKQTDFENKRKYEAAYYLCELQQDIGYVPYNSTKETEIEKCNFILTDESIAAKYLTVSDGFLYVQAIKENFDLPISVQDEDEDVKNDFGEFFIEVAEEDPKLAVDIWAWVVKEFGEYKQYIKNDWTIYNSIFTSISDYPDEFLLLLIKKLGTDIKFCNALITENPQFPYGLVYIIAKSLETDNIKEAQVVFTAVAMNPNAKAKDMENLIYAIINECSNWEEVETMEKFKTSIIPIIKKMNSKRIQRLLPKFTEEIDSYIEQVEASEEKYQYVRRFKWRGKYKDTPLFDINPLDYETEEKYLEATNIKKQAWQKTHAEANFYGIDLSKFDSEEKYQKELHRKKEEIKFDVSRLQIKNNSCNQKSKDNKIYNFCAVIFQEGSSPYTYLYDCENIKIGDMVIVPVGSKNRETIATVVATSQHTRATAPLEIENAKKVLQICKLDK